MKNIALIAFLTATPLQAQDFGSLPIQYCADTETVRGIAMNQFNEVAIFRGITSPIHVDELFYDAQDGSFSYIRSNIETGNSCVIASGFYGMMPRLGEPA